MKIHVLLATLLVAGATNSLMSMQQDRSLNFLVDHNMRIRGYSQQNMDFLKKPSGFLGEFFLDVVAPLNHKDHSALVSAFVNSAGRKSTEKALYTFQGIDSTATITWVESTTYEVGINEGYWFLKVQEAKEHKRTKSKKIDC